MPLQAHDDWEIANPVFQAIDPPGTHRYAMVEIAASGPGAVANGRRAL